MIKKYAFSFSATNFIIFLNIIKIIYVSCMSNRGLNLHREKNQGRTYLA